MNVLENILEEIEEMRDIMKSTVAIDCFEKDCEHNDCTVCVCERAMEIIRSHMDDYKTFEFDFNRVKSFDCQCGRHYVNTYNNGWIPIEEKLPEDGELVKVTVHSSEWIGDFDSNWVPEEDKMYHPEEYHVYDGYLSENGIWNFYDEEHSENICEKEFGTDKGSLYDVVTAWMPIELPEPYKGE